MNVAVGFLALNAPPPPPFFAPHLAHTHTHKRQRVWSETGRRPARSLRTKRPPTSTYKRESSRTHPTRGTFKNLTLTPPTKTPCFHSTAGGRSEGANHFSVCQVLLVSAVCTQKKKKTCLKSILIVNMYIYHFILHTS